MEAVYEKDIDLLIVEEFQASEDFREWFLQQISEGIKDFDGAWRSVTKYNGESDIEIAYTDHGDEKTLLLVEDKIKEKEQLDQAERYEKRGKHYIETTEADRYTTLILAPEQYLNEDIREKYDHVLTYEKLQDYFESREDDRSEFKAQVFQEAIEHGQQGYIKSTDEETTEFWNFYEKIASEYPALEFSLSSKPASGQTWSHFNPSTIGEEAKIIHKMERGVADLTLQSQADRIGELRRKLELEDDMKLVETGKSASIRVPVPEIKEPKKTGEKGKKLRNSMKKIKRLLDWEQDNRELLKN